MIPQSNDTFAAGDVLECVDAGGNEFIRTGETYSCMCTTDDGWPMIINDKGYRDIYRPDRFRRAAPEPQEDADWLDNLLLNCQVTAALSEIFAPAAAEDAAATEAHGYLSRLLTACFPNCVPLPDLIGVCTQIDNVIAGYRRDLGLMSERNPSERTHWSPAEDASPTSYDPPGFGEDEIGAEDDDADRVGCEQCDACPLVEEAISCGDAYLCPKCYGEWKAQSDKCAHVWDEETSEFGERGRICRKCGRFELTEQEPTTRMHWETTVSGARLVPETVADGGVEAWVRMEDVRGAFHVGVWSERERNGMAKAFSDADGKHGHYETLFAVAAWILRDRYQALRDVLATQPAPVVRPIEVTEAMIDNYIAFADDYNMSIGLKPPGERRSVVRAALTAALAVQSATPDARGGK